MDTSTTSPEPIDVTAEESCPAPSIHVSRPAEAQKQASAASRAPSSATFELMDQLEALARDVAENGGVSPDRPIEDVPEGPHLSPALPAVEPSIIVPPRPTGLEIDPFSIDRIAPRGRATRIVSSLIVAALVGLGAAFAWQSLDVPSVTSPGPSASAPAAEKPASAEPSTQAAAMPATPPSLSPDFAKQLDALAQDLASVRRGLEQLTAKQEQLAGAQQQLERLAAKQDQLAAKQEQMVQSVAKLQALEQTARQKTSARSAAVPPPSAPSRAASLPTRLEPVPPPPSTPRPVLHPVPPMPVPP